MIERALFPLLSHHKDLIYLDQAATSQKPHAVIHELSHYYSYDNAPIYRSTYRLAEEATQKFEQARGVIARFIGADADELIFVSNATAGINFIAESWGRAHINAGDEIVLTELEHHANLLPWQRLVQEKGAVLKFIPVDVAGILHYELIDKVITSKTKLVSFLDVSNALGVSVDISPLVKAARAVGARILIDACQSVAHRRISVKDYDCDFLVFSSHKMCGPTGIGGLYIKKAVQPEVPPYQVGGGMVHEAQYHEVQYLKPPRCYEAGTPPVAQAVGLARACTFLEPYMIDGALHKHSNKLVRYALEKLEHIPHVKIIGPIEQLKQYATLFSFIHTAYHAHDVGAYLAHHTIAVRTGHYCAQPLAKKLGIDASVRVSFFGYNTVHEVDTLVACLEKLQ